MGQYLMEKELSILSQENEEKSASVAPASLGAQATRPIARPYGVLVVSGLPTGYQVVVNRIRYPSDGEIHLPASRHLLEIEDSMGRSLLRDSITVGGGEPTVYEYARRAGLPLSQRAEKP